MRKRASLLIVAIILAVLVIPQVIVTAKENEEEKVTMIHSGSYGKGYRYNIQGWVYLHIEGEPHERGYQYGYLAANEIVDMMKRWSNFGQHDDFMKVFILKKLRNNYDELSETYWNLCKERGMKYFWDQYPEEYQEEIKGIAEGIKDRGGMIHGRPVEYQDVFTLSVIEETRETYANPGGLGRPFKTIFDYIKTAIKKIIQPKSPVEDDKNLGYCTAFMAAGDATADGRVIVSHSLVIANYMAQRTNMILDVQPSEGHRFVMTVFPGYIWSSQDFLENEAGITLMETVIWPPFGPWKVKGNTPVGVRVRKAIQYSDSIDDVIETLLDGNNGLYPSDWLIGDTEEGEIASLELGLYNHAITRTKNGYLWSCCNMKNNKVRWEQWSVFGLGIIGRLIPYFNKYIPSSIDQKFKELGDKHYGQIDTETVKEIMSTYEICHIVTDCKITDSELIKNLGLWAHLGRPDGFHYIPSDKELKKYHGVQENPGTGWLKIYASKSNPTGLQDLDEENVAKKTSKILWTYQSESSLNAVESSNIVSDETYISASINKIITMNAKSGRQKWEKEMGEKIIGTAMSKDTIYTGTEEGVYAIDKETGRIKWEQLIGDVTTDPVIADEEVIVGCSNGNVYSFKVDTGKIEWLQDFTGPAIVSKGPNKIYIGADNKHYAYDLNSKDLLWEYETNGVITKNSATNKNTVFFGSWDGNLYAFDEKTGELKWTYSTGWGIETTPAIANGIVYVGSNDNNFYAIDEKTGELMWYFTCKAGIHSSPVVYGDLVFFGSDDGNMYALDKTSGELVWSFAPGFTIKDDNVNNFITTPILSDPIVEDGVVYIEVKGTVYALDAQTSEIIETTHKKEESGIDLVLIILVLMCIFSIVLLGQVFIKNRKKQN